MMMMMMMMMMMLQSPSGRVMQSSSFSQGHFSLLLQNPIEGGQYTCQVPPEEEAKACIKPQDSRQAQGSITIDQVGIASPDPSCFSVKKKKVF
jgi:hypothetical protein